MTTYRSFLLAAAVMAACASSASAATWTFTGTNGGAATTSYTAGNPDLTIAGVSSFGGTGNWTSQSLLYWSGSGLGMGSDGVGSPNHAIDNQGNTEAVLLSFDVDGNGVTPQSVILTQIATGWVASDADISVFRYTGTSAPVMSSTNPGSMTGWELVGNYSNVYGSATGTTNGFTTYGGASVAVDSGGKGSSWWLISAYNSSYGTGTKLNQGDDYFKLFSVSGNTCTSTTPGVCSGKVPEPGSLALVGLGLLGMMVVRRQRQQNVGAAAA